MNMNFNFNNPTNILFGRGMLNELGKQPLPGKRLVSLFQAVNPLVRTGILTVHWNN